MDRGWFLCCLPHGCRLLPPVYNCPLPLMPTRVLRHRIYHHTCPMPAFTHTVGLRFTALPVCLHVGTTSDLPVYSVVVPPRDHGYPIWLFTPGGTLPTRVHPRTFPVGPLLRAADLLPPLAPRRLQRSVRLRTPRPVVTRLTCNVTPRPTPIAGIRRSVIT